MTGLRLTIGIPTRGDRPERLDKAIGAALAQTVPCRVLVSNQGASEGAARITGQYAAHPFVRVVESPASCLWENWTHAAEMCDTELFAWLQDDDVVIPRFAERVITSFDACPSAKTYLARLVISHLGGFANWWQATGPMVPMDIFGGGIYGSMDPAILAIGAYFTSHALSPGVAFRWSTEAIAAIRRVPKGADLFAERSVLAEFAKLGPAVCDPAVVGYWVQHEGNESKTQNKDNGGERQYQTMLDHVDPIISGFPNWQAQLAGWSLLVGRDVSRQWHLNSARYRDKSKQLDEAVTVLENVHPCLVGTVAVPERSPAPETATNGRHRRAEKAVTRR